MYEFDKGPKEIYFAHSMPYTYTMLNNYLNKNVTKEKAKRVILCHSLAGNKVEYLYISNKNKKIEGSEKQEQTNDIGLPPKPESMSPKKTEKG